MIPMILKNQTVQFYSIVFLSNKNGLV